MASFNGCGKRGRPLPPIERVPQRVEISGFQRGNRVNLVWTMPARNASGGSVLSIERVDIYRFAEPVNSTLSLTEEEFAARSTLIASVPVTDTDFARKTLSYSDVLDFAGQAARLRYAIRFVNSAGQKAAFSNFLLIEPAARVAESPVVYEVKTTENAVIVKWNASERNLDGSQPANVSGYNVYRKIKGADNFRLLNNTPVSKTEFADEFFEFDKPYIYLVRAVSLGTGGAPVESLDSNAKEILPRDVFAPSPPSAVTIAAAPNNLSIFFAVNPEKDVAGYRVYRSTDPNLAKSDWQLLTKELLTTNTFQDTKVVSGKTYYYYLTAVDKSGNVSQPSEVFSETAP